MRTLLAALVLLLAAAGAWWLLGDDDATTDSVDRSPDAPIETTAIAPDERRSAVDDAVSRSPLAPAPEPERSDFLFRIRVVRDEDGAPVPDAELRYLPRSFDGLDIPASRRSLLRSDREQLHAEFGSAQHADAQGVATIAHDDRALSISAREGDRFASQTFTLKAPARGGVFELRLTRDEVLELRTLDGSDAPIEGIVVWCQSESTRRSVSVGPSDRDGRIVIRRANDLCSRIGDAATCTLLAEVFGGDGDPTKVSLAPLPAEPVVVRIPPCAAFDIHCFGPDGKPWLQEPREDSFIWVRPAEPGPSGPRGIEPLSLSLSLDGTVRAWPLRCGAKFKLDWIEARASERTAQAPEQPGDSLRVEFRMPAGVIWLTGRLLNEDRSPRGGRHYFGFESGAASSERLVAVRDDGRFRVVLGGLVHADSARIRVVEFAGSRRAPSAAVAFEWPRPLFPGANELGDIVVPPSSVLVTVRAEWSDGEPVEGATVGVANFGNHRWRSDPALRAEHRDDGSFLVRGLRDERRIRITVNHREAAASVEHEFVPGAENVVVRLSRGGELAVRFLVDESVPWQKLEIALHDLDSLGRGPARWVPRPELELDGDHLVARWIGLRPGRFGLQIAEGPSLQVFLSIWGIEVPPGRSADDPRLRDIDLRGLVHRIKVLVTDESGAPLLGRLVHVLRRGGLSWPGHQTKDGQVELISRIPVDLSIAAEGYRTHELLGVIRDGIVRLEPAPRHLVRSETVLPPGTSLRVLLVPADADTFRNARFWTESSSGDLAQVLGITPLFASFDAPSEIEWRPRVDGVWRVSASVVRKRTQPIEVVEPQTIDTRLLPTGSVLTIRPDPAALAAALAKLPD
ncbi:MAG: hypothetical protein HZB39_00145 [Planctomycetes bacterium]|nr:hypothetical protein [Planctomycetota bacterium]